MAIPTDNLRLLLDASNVPGADGASIATFPDSTGNGYDAVCTNVTKAAVGFNRANRPALAMNGTTSRMVIPASGIDASSFTLHIGLRPDSGAENYCIATVFGSIFQQYQGQIRVFNITTGFATTLRIPNYGAPAGCGQPIILSIRSTSTAVTLAVNGHSETVATSSPWAGGTELDLEIGHYAGGGVPDFSGEVFLVAAYSSQTVADFNATAAWAVERWLTKPLLSIAFCGNSIVLGYPDNIGTPDSYVDQIVHDFGPGIWFANFAVGGQSTIPFGVNTTNAMTLQDPAKLAAFFATPGVSDGRKIVFAWEGTNMRNLGCTVEQAIAAWQTYYDTVIAPLDDVLLIEGTLIPGDYSTFHAEDEVYWAAYNAWIRTTSADRGDAVLVDFSAASPFNVFATRSDTSVYLDGLHLTDQGNTYMAAPALPVLRGLVEADYAGTATRISRDFDWGETGLVGTLGYTLVASNRATLIYRTTEGVEEGDFGFYRVVVSTWNPSWDPSTVKLTLDDGQTGVGHAVTASFGGHESSDVGTGSGDVPIDQDGAAGVTVDGDPAETDCMQFLIGADGADAVEIVAYLKADYDAGRRATADRRGVTYTGTDGRWVEPLMLDAGTYRIVGNKDGYQVDSFEIVVP